MADDYNFSGLEPVQTNIDPEPIQSNVPTVAQGTKSGDYDLSGLQVNDLDKFAQSAKEDRYGTLGQTALTVLEGAGQGVLGPLAPLAEIKSGLTNAEDIRGRRLTNPGIHALGVAGGFGASAAFGDELGLPGVAGEVGNVAEHLIPGIAGVRTAAELATISAANQFSKMVEQDPNTTLGSAAVNIGLSAAMGGLGGNLLDKFNPLKYFAKNANATKAADVINEILGGVGGGLAGATVGGTVGGAMGFPKLGAVAGGVIGDKFLAPVFSALFRPLTNNIANSEAAEAAYDYLASANAGQRAMDSFIGKFFSKGAETLNLSDVKGIVMPSQASRDDLKKILEKGENFDNAINAGGNIAHYLPDHTTQTASVLSNAVNYFKTLKPNPTILAPLDTQPPVHKSQDNNYNRQLDVAQQPLVALQHVKDGTLIPQDLATLQTVWPGLHNSMIQKLTDSMIKNKQKAMDLPYQQRVSLNQFIGGTPLDTTMNPMAMQTIINTASPKSQEMAQQHKNGGPRNASSTTLNQINKVNQLSTTPLQARQFAKRE